MAAAGVCGALAPLRATAAQVADEQSLEQRIARVIEQYAKQGFHRTATVVDRLSGDWLHDEVVRIGLRSEREPFSINRVDPGKSVLIVQGRHLEGLPLFDGAFTEGGGVRGRLGPIDSDAEIGVVEAAPNTAAAGAIGEARRQQRHKAIVFVTRGGRPGLCPSNADSFLKPFGPPVLQVSSEESGFLAQQAQLRSEVQLIAPATRVAAASFNVTATIKGRTPGLPPLIVMTPRSGWYSCASERGGGIACWLELMRTLRASKPARDVLFVASSGHELGHLGIDSYLAKRPGIVPNSAGWIHLGANIGAATRPAAAPAAAEDPALRHATPMLGPANTIQASDDEFEGILSRAMSAANLPVSRRNPRGTVPGGEAENVHRGGGRYVSVIGSNALFHNPADRGSDAIDVAAIAAFTKVFAAVAESLI